MLQRRPAMRGNAGARGRGAAAIRRKHAAAAAAVKRPSTAEVIQDILKGESSVELLDDKAAAVGCREAVAATARPEPPKQAILAKGGVESAEAAALLQLALAADAAPLDKEDVAPKPFHKAGPTWRDAPERPGAPFRKEKTARLHALAKAYGPAPEKVKVKPSVASKAKAARRPLGDRSKSAAHNSAQSLPAARAAATGDAKGGKAVEVVRSTWWRFEEGGSSCLVSVLSAEGGLVVKAYEPIRSVSASLFVAQDVLDEKRGRAPLGPFLKRELFTCLELRTVNGITNLRLRPGPPAGGPARVPRRGRAFRARLRRLSVSVCGPIRRSTCRAVRSRAPRARGMRRRGGRARRRGGIVSSTRPGPRARTSPRAT